MDTSRFPTLLIAAAVLTSLLVGFVPGLQPPAWHEAVTAVAPSPIHVIDTLAAKSIASGAPEHAVGE